MSQRTGSLSEATPCTWMVTSFTFIVQSPTLLNKFLFAPDLRIIPDQHYFSTDAVINHHYIHPVFLSAIILKQFKETLYTYSRPLLTCEWIGQHIVKRMMLQVKDCQKFTALLLLCYSPAFSEQFERLNKGWVTQPVSRLLSFGRGCEWQSCEKTLAHMPLEHKARKQSSSGKPRHYSLPPEKSLTLTGQLCLPNELLYPAFEHLSQMYSYMQN